ncbi:MAG: sensor histidine kinase [Chthoniobacteraceae bacterium]|jgi:signal transduction histidine kinase
MKNFTANDTVGTIRRIEQFSKPAIVAITFGIFFVVAAADYLTGYEISCTVFYLLAVGFATWYIGAPFGIFISLLSAVFTSLFDVLTGQKYPNRFVAVWDAVIVLSFYFVVVWLLHRLRMIQDTLEERIRERTAVLTSELAERKRLEKEILVISEREQHRIGRDIHDSLCQHLTGAALAEQFLVQKLTACSAPEVEDADRVVSLIEEAISMARGLAVGLSPIESEGEGLLTALTALAAHFSSQFEVACRFDFGDHVLIHDTSVATHIYRISQEAVHNAIRHGKARDIAIHLGKAGAVVTLTIIDDGCGLPGGVPLHYGMGLRNMKYRASIIGGTLTLERGKPGTIVTCSFCEGGGLLN